MTILSVNPRSPLPLHVQAEHELRKLIGAARYRHGELLPDELTLAATLGVSRGTVRTAILRLVSEGLIERRPGVGTRVAPKTAESSVAAWRSLTREMAAKGIKVETYALKTQKRPAPRAAARALVVDPGTPIYRLDRLRGWRGMPVLHSRSWFHPRLGLKGNEDFTGPLYEVIQAATGVVADGATEELLAVAAEAKMAGLLRVRAGAPLLLRRHVVFDRGRRPFEYAEVHYVSDRYTLTIDLARGDR
ncbi:MAG: GntR family transcriptional regulator [Planctomycetota bacterium]|nr:MAG: GntR family transcriptional regulator [Planctomycetota bacterium]